MMTSPGVFLLLTLIQGLACYGTPSILEPGNSKVFFQIQKSQIFVSDRQSSKQPNASDFLRLAFKGIVPGFRNFSVKMIKSWKPLRRNYSLYFFAMLIPGLIYLAIDWIGLYKHLVQVYRTKRKDKPHFILTDLKYLVLS